MAFEPLVGDATAAGLDGYARAHHSAAVIPQSGGGRDTATPRRLKRSINLMAPTCGVTFDGIASRHGLVTFLSGGHPG